MTPGELSTAGTGPPIQLGPWEQPLPTGLILGHVASGIILSLADQHSSMAQTAGDLGHGGRTAGVGPVPHILTVPLTILEGQAGQNQNEGLPPHLSSA